jgi:hypothetical protein
VISGAESRRVILLQKYFLQKLEKNTPRIFGTFDPGISDLKEKVIKLNYYVE